MPLTAGVTSQCACCDPAGNDTDPRAPREKGNRPGHGRPHPVVVRPPDLTLAARSRSRDWLYTYLRSFYRDPTTKSGWNNTLFPNVAMPHVLWEYQGVQALQVARRMDEHTGDTIETRKLVLERPGTMKPVEYDQYVADLVNYLSYMAEPAQTHRKLWGIVVLFFLAGFFGITLALKREYWKDVR